MHTQKIATCCYCGSRTILQLTARDGHELACGSCGAPIHEMKPLRKQKVSKPKDAARSKHDRKKPKKKKRSGLWQMLEEVIDVVDDIID